MNENKASAMYGVMMKYLQGANIQFSPAQNEVLPKAVRWAYREVHGNPNVRRNFCQKCGMSLRTDVGTVTTTSPRANASFGFNVCMKHIKEIEEWIRGEKTKFGEKDERGQERLT